MIDADGFRPNVGIVIANALGQVLWARRVGGQDAWQFPQGGMNGGESPEQCLYRELHEEVGLTTDDVRVLACTQGWLRYKLPPHMRRGGQRGGGRGAGRNGKNAREAGRGGAGQPRFKGQKQKWFLLQLVGRGSATSDSIVARKAEFDGYTWVSYWYPVNSGDRLQA